MHDSTHLRPVTRQSRTGHSIPRSAAPAAVAETEMPALTPREMAILRELAFGKSTAEIAAGVHLSQGTVKGYLSSIMAKWDARDRVEVLVLAVRSGTIRIPEPQ